MIEFTVNGKYVPLESSRVRCFLIYCATAWD